MKAQNLLCKVKEFKMLTPTVFQIDFETEPAFEFKAGQFISIVIPNAGPGGRDLRRAYSIASHPQLAKEKSRAQICVKLVEDGPGTNYLYKLRPGDTFKGTAPFGDFVHHSKPNRDVCFIATGTGISPFRSIIHSAEFKATPPQKTWLLFGARHEDELLYDDEMRAEKSVHWAPAISRPTPKWTGFKGRVTDYLKTIESQVRWLETDFYLCGGEAMINEVKTMLVARGVQKDSVHLEVYYKNIPGQPS